MRLPLHAAFALLALAPVAGCSRAPDPVAYQNRTFYDQGAAGLLAARVVPEADWAPLDLKERDYVGKTVMGDLVRLSRPTDWTIRRSNNVRGARYIEYVSPRQFLFAVYERRELLDQPWLDVLQRYEDDAKKSGAELLGTRVPMATANAQARAYLLRRKVQAAKAPFVNASREVLARGENNVVLVQIVHPEGDLATLSDELMRVLTTLEVL